MVMYSLNTLSSHTLTLCNTGAQKDFGLEIYGERFAEAGIASLIFDYRTFGGSGGEPRHWVSPSRHLEDWQSAVGYVQSQLGGTVDTSKLMLWGTSFAGGHVLVTAAKLGSNVTAVISQVPFLDGKASFARSTKERGLGKIIRAVIAALHDSIRSLFHYPAAYYPLVGEPGGWNFMGLGEQDMADYYAKHPAKYQGGWRNMARCKLALEVGNYRPINFVPQITAPVLYIAATKDKLCPVDEVQAAANITANGQLVAVDKSHFQVYSGDALEYLLDKQVYFLRTAAGLPAVTTAEDS
eukprot:GHRR01025778.1.p1 GENE.GHRR01025778.1~~GHRR01025778.1.p1  ORF type:complete len:296 (+),score=103.70 GHRR01025778.1:683-1570(+)